MWQEFSRLDIALPPKMKELTEIRNKYNGADGREHMRRMLKKHGAESPKAIADAIFADLDVHRDDTSITDDQSVVVMRVC